MGNSHMITFEQAYAEVMARVRRLGHEQVDLMKAQGRVLAEDVCSDMDMPPFDKSAMDGYACRRADLAEELRVVEEIPAGRVPQHHLAEGQCAKIMTGAPMPAGIPPSLVDQPRPGPGIDVEPGTVVDRQSAGRGRRQAPPGDRDRLVVLVDQLGGRRLRVHQHRGRPWHLPRPGRLVAVVGG